MGVLSKIGRTLFPSRRALKQKLTMSTTADLTEMRPEYGPVASGTVNDQQQHQCNQEKYADEPLSPHHGTIVTTQAQTNTGSHHFFSDDFETGLYDEYDDDDTTMGPMILLHTSNCSSSTSQSGDEGDILNSYYHSHGLKKRQSSIIRSMRSSSSIIRSMRSLSSQGGDTVLEPSFEVALSGPSNSNDNNQNNLSTSEVLCDLLAACPSKPRKRLDHEGRPFLHIYDEGLSTVDEGFRPSPVITSGLSETKVVPPLCPEDSQIQARWALAREQL